jgi:hypothetical protein
VAVLKFHGDFTLAAGIKKLGGADNIVMGRQAIASKSTTGALKRSMSETTAPGGCHLQPIIRLQATSKKPSSAPGEWMVDVKSENPAAYGELKDKKAYLEMLKG